MLSSSFLKKVATCVVAGLTFAALLLVMGNSGTIAWFPPPLVFSLAGLSIIISILFPFLWQGREYKQKINSEKVYAFLYAFIRYCIAFNLAGFGWKKIMGLQFIVPIEIAGKPMNQQSGEWLTWYYFGHSIAFGLIIAILQIGGSCLLLFRRTLLLGAVILSALMLNLTLINIFYGMNAGALLQSVVLTMGVGFLLLLHYKQLVDFFLKEEPTLPAVGFFGNKTKALLRASAILLSLLFVLYLKATAK